MGQPNCAPSLPCWMRDYCTKRSNGPGRMVRDPGGHVGDGEQPKVVVTKGPTSNIVGEEIREYDN